MELSPATTSVYLRHAFTQMLAVADRLGDARLNERPLGPRTNAVGALIVHCCAVTEFWIGHVALGRPSTRDRSSEFSASTTLDEVHRLVDRTIAQALTDIEVLEAGGGRDEGGRQFLPGADTSDAAVVLHVVEELYQHLGHMELAADALSRERAQS